MPGPDHRLALPVGFRLAEYTIVKVLGQGGFGITYLARDAHLRVEVAIKEMLPREFATRADGVTVLPKRPSDAPNFAWAKQRFVEEARILASLRHPNIVQVARFLELNGTAYMVMDFVRGQDFTSWIRAHPRPAEQELLGILFPLLDGLELVHQKKVLHRDISPENILITAEGRPVLLDFGAARANAIAGQALTGVIRPGYSPIEQYQTLTPQGPYTDLYALAAVLIHALTGEQPPLSMDRCGDRDPYQPVAKRYRGKYSANFLQAVDQAFSIDPPQRPQSVAEWRRMLPGEAGPRKQKPPKPKPERDRDRQQRPSPTPRRPTALLLTLGLLALAGGGLAAYFLMPEKGDAGDTTGNGAGSKDPVTTHPLKPFYLDEGPPPTTPPPATPLPATPVPTPSAGSLADAVRSGHYVNSLGLEFVRVPGTKAMFGTCQVTRQDYAAYAESAPGVAAEWKSAAWNRVPVGQGADHPVVMVSWLNARAFCKWLSEKDTNAKGFAVTYRLPTVEEWRKARGNAEFPWGDAKSPPKGAGNYADETARATFGKNFPIIAGYHDGFATTSPVKTFTANALGLYDLGGNVQEWSADQDVASGEMLILGASWKDGLDTVALKNKPLYHEGTGSLRPFLGFRCVVSLPGD